MATTDSNGIVFLEETDPISPFHTTINTLQQGTSDAFSGIQDGSNDILVIHQVANVTERAALAATYGPTAAKPLYVDRQDASTNQKLERTEDGTNWTVVGALPDTGWIAPTLLNGWVNFGSGFRNAAYRRINGVVEMRGSIKSGSGVVLTFPSGYRPAATEAFTLGANDGTGEIRIDTSGNALIVAYFNGGDNGIVHLNPIRFVADGS